MSSFVSRSLRRTLHDHQEGLLFKAIASAQNLDVSTMILLALFARRAHRPPAYRFRCLIWHTKPCTKKALWLKRPLIRRQRLAMTSTKNSTLARMNSYLKRYRSRKTKVVRSCIRFPYHREREGTVPLGAWKVREVLSDRVTCNLSSLVPLLHYIICYMLQRALILIVYSDVASCFFALFRL